MTARARVRRPMIPAALLLVALLSAPGPGSAQDVSVDDFGWLAGTWEGPGPDGAVAEIHFLEPWAGTVPSIFRLHRNGRVVVLETISLTEDGGDLVMYVRHFDTALAPLEKEGAIELRLVEREGDRFVFENAREGRNPTRSIMTRTEDGFTSVSYLARPDGSTDEIRVTYRRAEGAGPGEGL